MRSPKLPIVWAVQGDCETVQFAGAAYHPDPNDLGDPSDLGQQVPGYPQPHLVAMSISWPAGKWTVTCWEKGETSLKYWCLTHWGRVTHICVSDLTIIGLDNGLSLGRRQAIIWTNAGILLIRPLGTNFNEMLIEILTFSFKKMRLKVSFAKWRPSCLGLNVLKWGDILRSCWPTGKIVSSDHHEYSISLPADGMVLQGAS